MDKTFLRDCLDAGMSLEAIGEHVGRHPSTVSYWLKKHGLRAVGSARHGAKRGAIDEEELRTLVESGLPLAEIAERFDRSVSSVRYWFDRWQIDQSNSRARDVEMRAARERPASGAGVMG